MHKSINFHKEAPYVESIKVQCRDFVNYFCVVI